MRYNIIIIMWVVYIACITTNNAVIGITGGTLLNYGIALKWWFISLMLLFVISLEHFTIWYEKSLV